jgi:hypothetical protein
MKLSTYFRKIFKYWILWKSRPVGAKIFHAEGRKDRQIYTYTDMTKLIVTFRDFSKAPKTETDFNQGFTDQAHRTSLNWFHLTNK